MEKFVKILGEYFVASKYTDFITVMELDDKFIATGYRSPRKFVREQHNDKWLAYQVIKRMEGK